MQSATTIGFLLWEQAGCNGQECSFFVVLGLIVRKLAPKAITANSMLPKRFAFFSSVWSLGLVAFKSQLMLTMCELAFVPIWTEPHLWEVFTHLGFVFANVCLRYTVGTPFLTSLIIGGLSFCGLITILIAISNFYAHFKNYYLSAYINGI